MSQPRTFLFRRAAQQLVQLSRTTSLSLPALNAVHQQSTSRIMQCSPMSKRALHAAARSALRAAPPAAATPTTWTTALRSCSASTRASFLAGSRLSSMAGACSGTASLFSAQRAYGLCAPTRVTRSPKKSESGAGSGQLQGVNNIEHYKGEEEEEQKGGGGEQEDPFNMNSGPGYLPFPPPFHTVNIVMILFLANILCYLVMNFGNDDWRDFVVEHFTLSHENWTRIYPLFTNAFYQENILQLLIDCWLLWQFGDTMLGFLGNTRMAFFAMLCTLGGSVIHIARQKFELHYGMDELEVRGRCYGPNPFIMGLVAIEGLIFRHLNFIQQPPIPFLVLTAFVMVIDVWRIFTTKPEEHGAATGGALMAYLFWALPTRMLGLDKLTATL